MSEPALPWIIVGCGRLGQTLGLLARRQGQLVRAIWNRTPSADACKNVDAEAALSGPLSVLEEALSTPAIVWLTVVDDALVDVAAGLSPFIGADSIVVHTSGSLATRLLTDAGIKAAAASMHPLQAITDPARALERLAKSYWSVEGDDRAVDYCISLLARLGVSPVRLEPDAKMLYHAAAVTSANLLVSLIDAAVAMATHAGIAPETARLMLVELAASSLDNLRAQSPAEALSGPVARGDETTIARHLESIAAMGDDNAAQIYRILTQRARDLRATSLNGTP
ncbi:MAG: DUF2520 domain-containing protein [Bradymonadaceae bacterium]|nr:DUF2520 domain-containing protein [Lujinxingiaceae bacterium]